MLDGRDAAGLLFAALQHRQLLLRFERVEIQRAGSIPGRIERVEHRIDILLITETHTPKLDAPTDKYRPASRHRFTLAQLIWNV